MLISEYRIVMPVSVDEYQVGQLFSVMEASKNETGGGDGVEIIKNEPFENHKDYGSGQYTFKKYHLASKVPKFVKMLAPEGSLVLEEEAWNAFPYCKTVLKNPSYMKDNFFIDVSTHHLADAGTTENCHKLSGKQLKLRKVVNIDIAMDKVPASDYKKEEDPTKVKSEKTGRGPLGKGWQTKVDPVMTSYKLVTCEFKWWGLQNRVEKVVMDSNERLHRNFHRQLYCWMDKWHGLSMKDIRKLEAQAKADIDKLRKESELRGTKGEDDE
ncbi:phosphatidylinositol transfer protein alpha isoform [Sphaeroforma arctica JP610]|uniref:Phosphatidylinositol transfer protein alpha isoform n=1 Tax=Sphaeroforma arctica JP610 TaxID=667725 RepID=A0A0L0FCR0_9EUKA|nr:phosphatidylinositol transfer protein alpha isoform [Sphaeroforma arctica JP610]KNC74539.1 phosphatidylinositol transfer protein alpha isoform [Sphaeroforma arctica JP610]|eukprot:XP_014148441.1 phosphatidylinositol transfer protein alpha isoform [Sphaeroforma arctica JP610]